MKEDTIGQPEGGVELQLKCIQYVLDWPGDPEIGVPLKVLTQKAVWEKLGVKVELHVVCPLKFSSDWLNHTESVSTYETSLNRFKARRVANRKSVKAVKSNPQNTIQYRRYGVFTFSDLQTIRKIPTVLEINTNNNFFYTQKSWLLGLLNRIQSRFVAFYCLGACAVTPELLNMQTNRLKEKSMHFTNTVTSFSDGVGLVRNWERPRFIFVGSENFAWNGVERINWLVRELTEYDFFIAGPIQLEMNRKNLTHLGKCSPTKLNSILGEMDFGLSTLAMEESGLTEAASLKSRTYLSAGLPVIGGVYDSELERIEGSYLQLDYQAGGNAPSNLPQMCEFVVRNTGRRIGRDQLEPISANSVESRRIKYLDQLLGARLQPTILAEEIHRND